MKILVIISLNTPSCIYHSDNWRLLAMMGFRVTWRLGKLKELSAHFQCDHSMWSFVLAGVPGHQPCASEHVTLNHEDPLYPRYQHPWHSSRPKRPCYLLGRGQLRRVFNPKDLWVGEGKTLGRDFQLGTGWNGELGEGGITNLRIT